MQFFSIENINDQFNIHDTEFSIDFIRKCCDIANVKVVVSSTNFFIPKKVTIGEYLVQNAGRGNTTFFYERINKIHAKYDYYSMIGIVTTDMLEIKKIFKIHKMKAFL